MTGPDLNKIYTGDCKEVMASWPENVIDTIITDPPYGLDFMGKDWDHGIPGVAFWVEALRIAKPGAMLLAFGGTRTFHRLTVAIEDAGWEIRDCLMWLYGSGFPKSLDLSKAIDKAKGAERKVVGMKSAGMGSGETFGMRQSEGRNDLAPRAVPGDVTGTALAKEWDGWGTALKPAWEPIILAMKPTDGTYAENAEKWGVAGLNVDGARIATFAESFKDNRADKIQKNAYGKFGPVDFDGSKGRWPANVLLDEDAAVMLDGVSGATASREATVNNLGSIWGSENQQTRTAGHNDAGGASRFFYVAKSPKAERNEGCDALPAKNVNDGRDTPIDNPFQRGDTLRSNTHPTVKPLELMKYLCNLTRTPTGGIVLDPFAGSGTTLWAAECHNRPWVGIELNQEYVKIAEARIKLERSQLKFI